jgi:hypothetical protein
MSSSIPAVQGTNIRHCILIDITVNETVYYISNAYSPITYNGHVYKQLGHFMTLGEIQDDLKATNNQIAVTLSGIPPDDDTPNYLNIILNSNIKGSRIQIYRAFFDNQGFYTPSQVYLRFNGYVSNYSLNDTIDYDNKTATNNIQIQCNSILGILEKRYSGRRTNSNDQQRWFPGDTGMYRVKILSDAQFDFGKPYVAPVSSSAGSSNSGSTWSGGHVQ